MNKHRYKVQRWNLDFEGGEWTTEAEMDSYEEAFEWYELEKKNHPRRSYRIIRYLYETIFVQWADEDIKEWEDSRD